jgi:predicted nuclease of restriction endonuclease-like (RecB) superfamily
MAESLKLYQKWEDMAKYLYVALQSYPKSEKYTLAADTRQAMMLLGRYIYRANSVSKLEKKQVIEQADIALVDLKLMIRMGMVLEFLPIKKYEILTGQTVEIGKMIGGWLKSTS